MRSIFALPTTLLALTALASALPQQSQETSTAQAINPINGLPIPVSGTVTVSASKTEPSTSSDGDDDEEDSDSESISTITAAPTLSAKPTRTASDSESESDSTDSSDTASPTSDSSSNDPNLVIWTDTAENTIITMTKVSTFDGPDPTPGVPPPWGSGEPERPTITVEITDAAGHTELVPTRSVDTFVVAYTGAAERLGGGGGRGERVWWLLGVVGLVGLW